MESTRFSNFSKHPLQSYPFIIKIKSYEQILPNDLVVDTLKFHMIPGYKLMLNVYTPRYPVESIVIDVSKQTPLLYMNSEYS